MRLILLIITVFLPAMSFASDFPAKEVYSRFSPSIVAIKASKEEGGGGMIGAGSIISNDGFVITNAHVVINKEDNKPYPVLKVYIKPGSLTGAAKTDLTTFYEAEVLKFSQPLDLAILKVRKFNHTADMVEFANPGEIGVGEEVVAIGHPEQGGFWSLTYGRISGEIRDYQGVSGKDVFQTDTSVNRGNSGGPLLDGRGYMVAINSNIARVSKDGLPITGVNFAIKSSVVLKWLGEVGITVKYGNMPVHASEKIGQAEKISGNDEKQLQMKTEAGGRFITPKRPYDYDALLKAAEKDLEDMMDEMKGKFKR